MLQVMLIFLAEFFTVSKAVCRSVMCKLTFNCQSLESSVVCFYSCVHKETVLFACEQFVSKTLISYLSYFVTDRKS